MPAARLGAGQPDQPATETIRRDRLRVSVTADGMVQAGQTTLLVWKTTGIVESVSVQVGSPVAAGQELARLKQASLPQALILAQAERIKAHRALEDLQSSDLLRAKALQAVEQAERALEDALSPELAQARAAEALSAAQKELEEAADTLKIVSVPPSRAALDQAYSQMLLAQEALEETRRTIQNLQNKRATARDFPFFNLQEVFTRILRRMDTKLLIDERRYQETLQRYTDLQQPVDPVDVAVAEANLAGAQARFDEAQRDLEEAKAGPSLAEIAVLEARLQDSRREAERLKDGPTEQDLAAAKARLAAAEASLRLAALNSPIDGVVTQVNIHPGDQVQPGLLAFRLDKLDELLLEVQVSEIDINRLQRGQSVLVTLDAAPGRQYGGEVSEVAAVGVSVGGIVSFAVKISLLDADQSIKPGMTAKAEVTVEEVVDALLVPDRALRFLDGQRVVYVQKGGRLTPVPLKLGISSQGYSQVLEGNLQEGDLVVLSPPAP